MQIERDDARFVEGRAIADTFAEQENIAAMNWEDFEHLVTEMFEKEFVQQGAEVKTTQSSRDKGVDAILFDPDPIRGGNIIIQAKRYTNTVKVESVRALYGIMQDEGAMKGILITTSDYGPEAYAFAKEKPITLLNGNNLLSMLHKHGYEATIDLAQAKKIL
jgi:restriction system protein